jgi:hypothetical protein
VVMTISLPWCEGPVLTAVPIVGGKCVRRLTPVNLCRRRGVRRRGGTSPECVMTRLATTRSPAQRPGAAAWLHAALSSAPLAAALAIGALHGPCRSDTPEPPAVTVYVVSHGWHSGIVVPAALAQAHDWPARREFAQAQYFEVGWGDRAYYQAADPGWWMGLRALLWPSPGVLHVVALPGPPQAAFPGAPLLAVRISHQGAQRLAASIAASHERAGPLPSAHTEALQARRLPDERGADGAPIAFGPALYGQGRFYASTERFHLFATCNVWVARRLRDAGLDLHPAFALTSGMLFAQLARHVPAPPAPAASAASVASGAPIVPAAD